MGSGASAENARTTVAHLLTGKPADASDIKVETDSCPLSFPLSCFRISSKLEPKFVIFEESQEISKISFEVKMMKNIESHLNLNLSLEEMKHAAGKNGAKKREAVLDRGEQIKTSASYVPKEWFSTFFESI